MNDYLTVYQLLKKYDLRPRKGLGQNFLADENHLRKIVAAAELSADEVVLEIGPGLGALSRPLAQTVRRLVAVELDPTMVQILQAELAALANLHLVQADILDLDPAQTLAAHVPDFTPGQPYQVVANLPYYITSAIIQHLLEAAHPPQTITITVQKEVAQRIVAQPGQLSLLAVSVQFYGRPRLCHLIPAGVFVPPPKVDSAVLRIDRAPQLDLTEVDPPRFFRVVKAGFSQKRKQLKNSLAGGLRVSTAQATAWLVTAGIEPTRRAQTLTLAEWGALANQVYGGSL